LEFPIVFIAGLEENLFPHSRVRESVAELEEERRLCYVAITRAKRFCTLSYSRMSHKGSDEKVASIIESLPQDLFEVKVCEDSEKEMLATDPALFVASRRAEEHPVTKEMLQKLVADNYTSIKVSVTLLNSFYECPWKWYFNSFLRVPEPLSESLIFGSIVHGVIERVIKSMTPSPSQERVGVRLDGDLKYLISEQIKKSHVVDPTVIARFEKDATKVMTRFIEHFVPDMWDVRESEKALSYRDPSIPELLITGKIDLVESDTGGSLRVTDFKTGKLKTKNDIEGETKEGRLSSMMRQLAMYSYLMTNAKKGMASVDVSRLYFVEEVNFKNAIYSTHVGSEHIELLVKDMKDYDALMKSGEWTERECSAKTWGSGDECEYCKRAKMYQG
jgi:DNA helicase-2/ATP-dependent DNA helicase PcrA